MSLERLQILIRFHHQVQSYGSVLHAHLTDAERAAFLYKRKIEALDYRRGTQHGVRYMRGSMISASGNGLPTRPLAICGHVPQTVQVGYWRDGPRRQIANFTLYAPRCPGTRVDQRACYSDPVVFPAPAHPWRQG
jgi:hypothetical protein